MRGAAGLAATLMLAACAPPPADGGPDTPPPVSGSVSAGTTGLRCDAAALQDLVGQHRDVLATMRFGIEVRIEEPGMAYTTDYRENRLRIILDNQGMIVRVLCG